MRNKWTIEQILRGQNNRGKRSETRHDLTMEQWLETLEYFNYKCAYCGEEYEIIEHYLPVFVAGTTVSNCVPACLHCNIMKDRKGHNLSMYQNKNIIHFIESKGVKILFHIHKYEVRKKDHVVLHCDGCGLKLDVPGLPLEDAETYIDQFFSNTGYAYIA